jgi:hypothetical protein
MGEVPHIRTLADEQNEQYRAIAMVCGTLLVLRITYSIISFRMKYSQ